MKEIKQIKGMKERKGINKIKGIKTVKGGIFLKGNKKLLQLLLLRIVKMMKLKKDSILANGNRFKRV